MTHHAAVIFGIKKKKEATGRVSSWYELIRTNNNTFPNDILEINGYEI